MSRVDPAIPAGWIDWILAFVLAELAAGALLLARAQEARLIAPFASFLLAGACLLLALRAALAGSPSQWIALSLLGGLLAHVACLRQARRALRGAPGAQPGAPPTGLE